MGVFPEYTVLSSVGATCIVDSRQPAGVHLARLASGFEDGPTELPGRIEYIEDLRSKTDALIAAVASWGTEVEALRVKASSG